MSKVKIEHFRHMHYPAYTTLFYQTLGKLQYFYYSVLYSLWKQHFKQWCQPLLSKIKIFSSAIYIVIYQAPTMRSRFQALNLRKRIQTTGEVELFLSHVLRSK